MDEATRDLLAAIGKHLEGMADQRAVEVRYAALQARADGDAGRAADELRDLAASRREGAPLPLPGPRPRDFGQVYDAEEVAPSETP
jgi:hypothetical protein